MMVLNIYVFLCINAGMFIILITVIVALKKQIKINDELREFNNYLLDYLFRKKEE